MAEDSVTMEALRASLAIEKEKRQAAEVSLNEATRRTTFHEYLQLVHEHYAIPMHYDPKNKRNTKGGVTNPRHRITPTVIAPWNEFGEEQAATYRELSELFQDKRLFPNKTAVVGGDIMILEFEITSERALTNFATAAQVVPAKQIVDQFINVGLIFGNSRPGLRVRFSARGDPEEDTKGAFAPVDGVWDCDGPRSLEELKPPHKLPEGSLQKALDDGTGHPRRRFETKPIINSPHATKDPTYVVTAVFTQVFDYMIESGTTRAYLGTGMAYVFFDIRDLEPTTLYYSLVIPPRTSTAHPADTGACQLAMFICRCLTNPKRDADWIQNAVESNARFLVDPEAQLNLMSSPLSSMSEVVTPGKEDYKPPKRKRARSSPEPDQPCPRGDETSDDDSGDDSSPTRNRPANRSRMQESNTRGVADASQTSASGGNGSPTTTKRISYSNCTLCAPPDAARQYCSQTCLRGLMDSFLTKEPHRLDLACPNAQRHSQSLKYQLTHDEFRASLRRQLARSHVHAMEYLGLSGSSGHLFAITLCSHGYTFVGKGSRLDKVPSLAREARVYKTAHPLQGLDIPICLGLLELEGPYYLPAPNHLTHFLLLSYGGIQLSCHPKLLPSTEEVTSSIKMALTNLHGFNILHGDARVENFLWNTELNRATLVDFGESTLADMPNATLSWTHHLLSIQRRNRGVVQMDMKSGSSTGVRKNRKAGPGVRMSAVLREGRKREIDAVEGQVMRWLPSSTPLPLPFRAGHVL